MSDTPKYNDVEIRHMEILAMGNARVTISESPDGDYHVSKMEPGGNLWVVPGDAGILFIKALPDLRPEVSIVVGDEETTRPAPMRDCDIAIMVPADALYTTYLQAGESSDVKINMDLGAVTIRAEGQADVTVNTMSGVMSVVGNDQSQVKLASAHENLTLKASLRNEAKLDASDIHLVNPHITLADNATLLCASRNGGLFEKSGKATLQDGSKVKPKTAEIGF